MFRQPCTSQSTAFSIQLGSYPEEFAQARVVGLAWLPLCVFQIFCEPKPQDLEHAVDGVVRGADGDEGIGGVEVVPVFEIRCWLEQLGGQGEPNRGKIGDTDKSARGAKLRSVAIASTGLGSARKTKD